MGTEKKKHRRSSEHYSSQEDEVKSKRHKREEGDKEERREKKKGSSRKEKSHTSSKHRSDKEKSGEKHKSKSHKHKGSSKLKFEELSKDDYFLKNNEFASWLKEKKNMFFMDLSSEAAHELFMDFVKEWNKGKLASEYYEGILTGPRSSHNWNIKQ
ncbi:unnamed protein product [Cuscuta epithymum]|uniref:Uncharacterized protein n=1 Tax=Cuscuta epithymum TaxID=186058 RepID=A0AAV0EQ74_9ASTE|nr:unnamed protein product [Cuscuta epithymum]